jgi:hypothetical protein
MQILHLYPLTLNNTAKIRDYQILLVVYKSLILSNLNNRYVNEVQKPGVLSQFEKTWSLELKKFQHSALIGKMH